MGHQHTDGHEGQEHAGQGRAVAEHDDQGAHDGPQRHDQLQKAGLQCLGHLVQVAGDPAEDLPRLVLVKEPQGQPVQLPGHLGAEGEHQALRHAGHQIGLEVVEHPAEQVLSRQPEQLPPQGPCQGEGLSGLPGGLHLLPQVVDDDGAVHGVPDGQRHVGHDGDRHHRQPCPLPPQVAQQADRGALGCALHASASLVWDS